MIIYHGSNMIIKEPKVFKSNRALDFGIGFYATTFKEQAEKWAIRKCTNYNGEIEGTPIVSIYELDLKLAYRNFKVYEYEGVTKEWLEIDTAIKRLKFKSPNNQVCINNQYVIEKCLKFIGKEEVKYENDRV